MGCLGGILGRLKGIFGRQGSVLGHLGRVKNAEGAVPCGPGGQLLIVRAVPPNAPGARIAVAYICIYIRHRASTRLACADNLL